MEIVDSPEWKIKVVEQETIVRSGDEIKKKKG